MGSISARQVRYAAETRIMTATTPRKPEHANYTFATRFDRLTGQRYLESYAYAANGNLHNPTPRYLWLLIRDGNRVVDRFHRRSDLVKALSADYLND
jgi:hypothetical protein